MLVVTSTVFKLCIIAEINDDDEIGKSRFCPISDFLTFGQISDFHIFFPNRSQKLTKRARDLIFSLKCKAYM